MMTPDPDEGEYTLVNIFILALTLAILANMQIFADKTKNNALIYFAIVCALWGFTVEYRNRHTITKKFSKIQVPYKIKCFFAERKCDQGDINLWAIAHFVIYFIAGILFPGKYLFFLLASLFCEYFEVFVVSFNSKWFIDPIINMCGYTLGNIYVKHK